MRKIKAFTLIEIMIVVAIIGIMVTIAYPSYSEHIVRSKRADGMAALMNAAQTMERYRSANYSYALTSPSDLSEVFATRVPVDGGDKFYDLSIVTSARNFTLKATPTGTLSDDTLTLNNIGAKTWGTKDCWPESGNDC